MAGMSGDRKAHAVQRREDFYLAAARLFHQNGYHGTTLEQVARDLGLTKAAVYHYVRSKEALLYETYKWLLAQATQALDECLRKAGDLPPAQRLREMMLCHVRFIMANAALATPLSLELRSLSGRARGVIVRMRNQYEERFMDTLQAGVAAGVFTPAAGKVTLLLMFGAMNKIPFWYDPKGPLTQEQVAEAAVDYLLRGLLLHNSPAVTTAAKE